MHSVKEIVVLKKVKPTPVAIVLLILFLGVPGQALESKKFSTNSLTISQRSISKKYSIGRWPQLTLQPN